MLSLLSRGSVCYRGRIDNVSACCRCCQGDQCVIAVELTRYQRAIAVVKEISVLSRLN